MKNIQNILNTKFREKQQFNSSQSDRAKRRIQQRERKEFDTKMSIGILQTVGDKYWYNSLPDDIKNELHYDWIWTVHNSNSNYRGKVFTKTEQEKRINKFFINFCKVKYNSIKPNKTTYRENKINDLLNGENKINDLLNG